MYLQKWYEKGLSPAAYQATLTDHKAGFQHIYKHFVLPEDTAFFAAAKAKELQILVLAEPWCGHCMLNIPILLQLAEKIDAPVRFLLRDENLTLMDQYLTNGKSRSIPIFLFLNREGEEVGKWGPIADSTKQFVAAYRAELPEKTAPEYEEKFQAMVQQLSQAFREKTELWKGTYESMKATIQTL